MYPNPQDVIPLSAVPTLAQYDAHAEDLVTACRSREADAIHRWAAQWDVPIAELEAFARQTLTASDCAEDAARMVLARVHGFDGWPAFAAHLRELERSESAVSKFEAAAEVVIAGDIPELERILHEQPALIHARSTRVHRATLLHYAAANGVENYR